MFGLNYRKKSQKMTPEFSTTSVKDNLDGLSLNPSAHQESAPSNKQIRQTTRSLLSESLARDQRKSRNGSYYYPYHSEELNSTDEQPEPALLATSVGKDSDGRLIPSSSTISLLSLNQAPVPPTAHLSEMAFSGIKGSLIPGDRASSYTNLRSRNSITHLNQQRLQPYHKLTSPIPNVSSEFPASSSPSFVPLARNISYTPDSPNLDPISGHGSPSRFWLSSQTPPKTAMSSLRTPNKSNLINFTSLPKVQENEQICSHSVSQAIAISNEGNKSPILNPVLTPLEDLPMTPLFLNHGDHYFIANRLRPEFDDNMQDYYYAEKFSNLLFEERDQPEDEID